jgi:hypothetical protein
MEVSGQHHVPAAFLPGKEPPVPFEWGWVNPTGGLDVVKEYLLPLPVALQSCFNMPMHICKVHVTIKN